MITTPNIQPAATEVLPLTYHRQTEHSLARYAKGPEVLDWEAQPARFRRYVGTGCVKLPHVRDVLAGDPVLNALLRRTARNVSTSAAGGADLTLASVGVMLELGFGITAWKSLGPDRWPVRANPSSGNLHPVEVYLATIGVQGLPDGLYHYQPEEHGLESRAHWTNASGDGDTNLPQRGLWLALSTIPWRETWKYGERAFRYCQLDMGHALAALSVAAACLNWRVEQREVSWDSLQNALGLDRKGDFAHSRNLQTEHEEAELACCIDVDGTGAALFDLPSTGAQLEFEGTATAIDPRPFYSWPLISQILAATRFEQTHPAPTLTAKSRVDSMRALGASAHAQEATDSLPIRGIIQRRRSAQRFDAKFELSMPGLVRILDSLLPAGRFGNALHECSSLEVVLWVHRVTALTPGVYVVGRYTTAGPVERALGNLYSSQPIYTDSFRLSLVAPAQARTLATQARVLHCHQDIAASSAVTLGMFTDLSLLQDGPGHDYRLLLRAAGRMAHNLYLAAEHEGLRGTGIGCFFDGEVAEFLGLKQTSLRSVYHFCFGKPIDDPRIETSDPYPKEKPQ